MASRIVDLAERSQRNGHAPSDDQSERVPGRRPQTAPVTLPHLHEWDVDGVSQLTIDRGVVPNVAYIREAIRVDPVQRGYSYAVAREGQPSLVLQAKRHPGETRDQMIRREAILWFINEVLSASYGVPA